MVTGAGVARSLADYALLRLLYATGARVSEIISLRWRDLQDSTLGRGQVTLYGKGQKTRTVIFSAKTWQVVKDLRESVIRMKSSSKARLEKCCIGVKCSGYSNAPVIAPRSQRTFRPIGFATLMLPTL